MILLLLLLICVVTSFSLLGSLYARKYNSADALIAIYATFTVLTQILAVKIIEYDLGFAKFYASFATVIFAVTFLLTDIVNEKFGRWETHRMIFIALIAQVAMAVFVWFSTIWTPAPFWQFQDSWEHVFGLNLRITLASWLTFVVSENFDVWMFHLFRKLTRGRHLWMRNVFSSLPALAVDSVLFVTLAFYGIFPVLPMILSQVVVKWLVGIIDVPFMYLNRVIMGRVHILRTQV